MAPYIDTEAADDNLDRIENRIMIRFDEDSWGDSISAKRISEDTVHIITLTVSPDNENQGRGTALVQKVFDELPSDVKQVVIKKNDNPGWWSHIKPRIRGRANLVL
jgi:hypothetical protein